MRTPQVILLALLFVGSPSRGNDRARAVLVEHKDQIIEAAGSFGIAPRLLASIVYVEHSRNVKPGEVILDKVLALSGYNASVGIAQVKVETAMWIRGQISATNGKYSNYSGASALASSASADIVDQLDDPKTNLLYAAAYIKLVWDVWQPLLCGTSYQRNAAGFIGTLYSLGLLRADGTLRQPHAGAQVNTFGREAQSFYDSFDLRAEFP